MMIAINSASVTYSGCLHFERYSMSATIHDANTQMPPLSRQRKAQKERRCRERLERASNRLRKKGAKADRRERARLRARVQASRRQECESIREVIGYVNDEFSDDLHITSNDLSPHPDLTVAGYIMIDHGDQMLMHAALLLIMPTPMIF